MCRRLPPLPPSSPSQQLQPPSLLFSTTPTEFDGNGGDGYNSDDEIGAAESLRMTPDELRERERSFERNMRKLNGLFIRKMKPDGACLFRAIGKINNGHFEEED